MRENLAGDYYLVSDITFPAPGEDGFPAEGFEPVGIDTDNDQDKFQGPSFTGRFNGNGKTIRNFFIDRPVETYVGLFGRVQDATISNVQMEGVRVRGKKFVGAIAGESSGGSVSGSVVGSAPQNTIQNTGPLDRLTYYGQNSGTGALVGKSSGAVSGFARDLVITSSNNYDVGGLVGFADGAGNVVGYTENLNLTGPDNVGGLVGMNWGTGDITGYSINLQATGGMRIGGLLGATLQRPQSDLGEQFPVLTGYATGTVKGQGGPSRLVGGLVGQIGDKARVVGFFKGTAAGVSSVGGLVGRNVEASASVRGYMRGTIQKIGGFDNRTYAFLVSGDPSGANRLRGDIAGYHSGKSGEKVVSGISGNRHGEDGTEITVSSSTTQGDFPLLDFGSEPGRWTFQAGQWPSINLGDDPIFANARPQPVEP